MSDHPTADRSPGPGVEVTGDPVPGGERILTAEAVAFVAELHRRFAGPRRRAAGRPRDPARRDRRPGGSTSCPRRPTVREGELAGRPGPARPARPPGRDHRARPSARWRSTRSTPARKVWLADLEDANTPHWANVVGGQVNLYDAVRRTIAFTSAGGQALRAAHDGALADDRRPPARLAPRRAAPAGRRRARGRRAGRLRAVLLPQRRRAARPRQRAVLLPAQDGEPPRGPAVERRLHARRAGARHPARHDPRHRADRDHPGRVRDGGDPLRAARARLRAERRPLGLPVQHHQELPRRRRRSSCCPTAPR